MTFSTGNSISSATAFQCPVCGGGEYSDRDVLWPKLISAWELNPDEAALINRQQGRCCRHCGSNLRSMTLAGALLSSLGWNGTLSSLLASGRFDALELLEVNEAGSLSPYLHRFPGHTLAAHPQCDMQHLPFPDDRFDVVLHSDALEHVPDPVQGLRECLRVLRPGGGLLLTIPIVPSRLTRRRNGLPPSYHGDAAGRPEDFRVWTEYGADFFLDFIHAGWTQFTLFTLGASDSLAITGIKPGSR